jgi:hypothetical protein
MIQVYINPVRVEKVIFVAGSDIEQDFDFAAWQAIRALINEIDVRLGQISNLAGTPIDPTVG